MKINQNKILQQKKEQTKNEVKLNNNDNNKI